MDFRHAWVFVWLVVVAAAAAAAEQVEIVTPSAGPSVPHPDDVDHVTEPLVDSYLQALRDTQGGGGAVSRYDQQPQAPGPGTEPPSGYLPSKPSYHQVYQPYGPPTVATAAAPVQPFYGIPFASPASAVMSVLSGLMPKGIDLETVFKLILKLTLFKILVKFFAVICLLLAYPLFQSKDKNGGMMEGEEEEEEDRQLNALNNLTAFVWDAIDPGNYTQVERIVDDIDANMTRPSESAAIGFLEFCVNLANMSINWMTSMLRRRRRTGTGMDPVQVFFSMVSSKFAHIFIH